MVRHGQIADRVTAGGVMAGGVTARLLAWVAAARMVAAGGAVRAADAHTRVHCHL